MNIVTTNTTGVIMPYSTTYIYNTKSYRYNCSYDSNISDVGSYEKYSGNVVEEASSINF